MVVFLSKVKEGVGDSRVVGYKLMVEVSKVQEGLYTLDFDRGWPGGDSVEFDWIHGKLTRFHNHSKVFDFRDVELAFLELQMKVEFSHALEDMTGLFFMGSQIGRGDEEVIHVDESHPSAIMSLNELFMNH